MEKIMHLAAQYLAAAGISFLEKKKDYSHTNLGFSTTEQSMQTRLLSEKGNVLSLNYNTFALDWKSANGKTSFSLDGVLHRDVLAWLTKTSKAILNKSYRYEFDYELPYAIDDNFIFKLQDAKKLKELSQLRSLAQLTIDETLQNNNLESEVRVWPHHFDTGAYASLNKDSDISVGLGLAIPDSVCEQHYFYISGYKGNDAINIAKFPTLTKGKWKNDGFIGAILPALEVDQAEAVQFFRETIDSYKQTNL